MGILHTGTGSEWRWRQNKVVSIWANNRVHPHSNKSWLRLWSLLPTRLRYWYFIKIEETYVHG